MRRYGFVFLVIWVAVSTVCAQDNPGTPTVESTPETAVEVSEGSNVTWFTADTASPLIGQPIHLKLTVQVPSGASDVITWPDIPLEEWPPFWVTEVGEVVEQSAGNVHLLERTITATLWEVGEFRTPETYVTMRLASGEVSRERVRDVFFSVTGSLGADLDLRPLKPQIQTTYVSPLLAVVGGLVVAVILTGLIWWWRRGARARGIPGDSSTPAGRALAELDALARQDLPPAQLFPLVANCLRDYIQTRFFVPAQDMTTNEVITALRNQGYVPEGSQKELRRILEYADLVKFANFQPGKKSVQQLLMVVRGWLARVESVAPVIAPERPTE
jgi:hypothetical protein